MKLYKAEWKLFLRSIYLPILYVVSFLFYQWQHLQYVFLNITKILPLEGLMAIYGSNANIIYVFAVMLFIGFEIRIRSKNQFAADLACGKTGISLLTTQVLMVGTLSAIMLLSALPYDIIMLYKVEVLLPSAVINVVLANVLSYLLIPFTAGLMGMALGSVTKRIGGYAAMAIMLLIISPATGQFFWSMGFVNEIWLLPKKLFSFFTPNTQWMSLSIYGVAVEAQRWLLLVFWQAVSLFVLLPKLQRKKTYKIVTGLACCFAMLFSFQYAIWNPGSVVHMSEDELGIGFESESSLYDTGYLPRWEESAAKFAVTEYGGSLAIDDRLHGNIVVKADKSLSEYEFYLYRGYTIQGIYDQNGTPLPYTREGHLVQVTAEASTETMRFVYSGDSPSHFSNYQAVYLPANFTYYPIPAGGWISPGGTLAGQPQEANFTVSVSAPLQLYSNLSVTDGVYAGAATGMTLQGGVLESKTVDGFTEVWSPWYMPGGDISKEQLQKEITELCAEMGIDEIRLPQRFTLFCIDPMYQDLLPVYSKDHIVADWSVSYAELAMNYVLTRINSEPLSYVKNQVIYTAARYYGGQGYYSDYETDIMRLYSDLYGGFNIEEVVGEIITHIDVESGRSEVLQVLREYLTNPFDFASSIDYFKDVGGWNQYREGLR